MLLVVVCSDGAGSACWARTKDHRGHASVPDGGDGRSERGIISTAHSQLNELW